MRGAPAVPFVPRPPLLPPGAEECGTAALLFAPGAAWPGAVLAAGAPFGYPEITFYFFFFFE